VLLKNNMYTIEQIEEKQRKIQNKMQLASEANKGRYLELFERLEKAKFNTCGCGHVHLAEMGRELTEFENAGVIEYLQETFDTQEEELARQFEAIKQDELLPSIERAESKIKDAVIPTLLLLYFLRKKRIQKAIKDVQATSYERGKTSAIRELKADGVDIDRPSTPVPQGDGELRRTCRSLPQTL